MTELLTAAQMRAIEEAAIESGEVTGLELMERAGKGVVEAIFAEWPELRATSHRAVVLCGPGNNGGDGFVVARLLKEWGWDVEVFLYGAPEKLPPDARVNYERWRAMGGHLSQSPRGQVLLRADLLIDALFGIGLNRELPEEIAAVTCNIHAAAKNLLSGRNAPSVGRVVSIDVPSGMCSDSGKWLGGPQSTAFPVDLTVTFTRMKPAHLLAANTCGRVKVVDLGLRSPWGPVAGRPVTSHDVQCRRRHDLQKDVGHKYAHGHALIVCGTQGRAGAARLAARGALRIGAGLVTVASPPDAMAENAARLDAIMLRAVADATALAGVLADRRINAACLGPGMGTGRPQAQMLAVALERRADAGLVLDADALTILSHHPDLFATLHENCILTPHAGEFARLFPYLAAKLNAPAIKGPAYSKVDATREAAALAGCVVLFKGPDTVIADPSGRAALNAAVHDRAAPWLATAGSGDVLAGFITGLLARGFSPFDAACTGAWLHVEAARSFGPGLIAEDLPEELPKVFRALGV